MLFAKISICINDEVENKIQSRVYEEKIESKFAFASNKFLGFFYKCKLLRSATCYSN